MAPDASAAGLHQDAPALTPAGLSELEGHPRYRVEGLLGRGGMGAVYKAEHLLMGRPVALKVINASLVDDPAALARFRQEVRAAARLFHPNIVTAFDADQAGDLHFLVMEYVEGENLADYLRRRGPLPVAEACEYARQAALGLQHAHERGMVHRDIKPHNLMRTHDGHVKVLDFGLARFARTEGDSSGQLTGQGAVMGTADYIAPEQTRDARAADIRSDLYAIGSTLYHLLSGRVPFPGGSTVEKMVRHAVDPPPSIASLRPDLPAGLVGVVEKLMAKDPARRYQTPGEVAQALAPYAATVAALQLGGTEALPATPAGPAGQTTEAHLPQVEAGMQHLWQMERVARSAARHVLDLDRHQWQYLRQKLSGVRTWTWAAVLAFIFAYLVLPDLGNEFSLINWAASALILFALVWGGKRIMAKDSTWRQTPAEGAQRLTPHAATEIAPPLELAEAPPAATAEQTTETRWPRVKLGTKHLPQKPSGGPRWKWIVTSAALVVAGLSLTISILSSLWHKSTTSFTGPTDPHAPASVAPIGTLPTTHPTTWTVPVPEDDLERADYYAERSQWDKAIAAQEKVVARYAQAAIQPDPQRNLNGFLGYLDTYQRLAFLHLVNGDQNGYRKVCEQMRRQFAKSNSPFAVFHTARVCSAGPGAIDDPGQLAQETRKAFQSQKGAYPLGYETYRSALGSILYRAGRFEEAAQYLELIQMEPARGEGPDAWWNCPFLAMAHHRLGHAEAAQFWLRKSAKINLSDSNRGFDRCPPELARLLHREAEAVVAGKTP